MTRAKLLCRTNLQVSPETPCTLYELQKKLPSETGIASQQRYAQANRYRIALPQSGTGDLSRMPLTKWSSPEAVARAWRLQMTLSALDHLQELKRTAETRFKVM